MAKPKLGSGERSEKLEAELEAKGARNPKALGAWIGRKNYGKARYQRLSAKGQADALRKGK